MAHRSLTPNLAPHERIIVAFDKSDFLPDDHILIHEVAGKVGMVKVGLQAINARLYEGTVGLAVADYCWMNHGSVFWDIKLKDIQNTVVSAIQAIGKWQEKPKIVTIHATQKLKTLVAALEAAHQARILLAGVSLLTDHDDIDARAIYCTDSAVEVVVDAAERMAEASQRAGVPAALVCAPGDLKYVTEIPLIKITPGIRDTDAPADDQNKARTMTASEAILAGADYEVIGRPIMQAPDRVKAIAAFTAQIAEAIDSPVDKTD